MQGTFHNHVVVLFVRLPNAELNSMGAAVCVHADFSVRVCVKRLTNAQTPTKPLRVYYIHHNNKNKQHRNKNNNGHNGSIPLERTPIKTHCSVCWPTISQLQFVEFTVRSFYEPKSKTSNTFLIAIVVRPNS